MKKFLMMTTAALALSASMASAQVTADEIVTDLQDADYTKIEVKVGPTQIKIEAIRGDEKYEAIIDRETGDVLKAETEAVEAGDDTTPGVEIENEAEDFDEEDDEDEVDDEDDDEDDDDDDEDDDDDDDDDDD